MGTFYAVPLRPASKRAEYVKEDVPNPFVKFREEVRKEEKEIAEYRKNEADVELEEGFKKANDINKHYGLPDVERKQPEAEAGGPQAGLH